MSYEDVEIQKGEKAADLAVAYGHPDAKKIWADPRNHLLRIKRGTPGDVKPGDHLMVPIPWKISTPTLTKEAHGVGFEATRDGGKGTRLSWVQTVYQDNQPATGTTKFCWTDARLTTTFPFTGPMLN